MMKRPAPETMPFRPFPGLVCVSEMCYTVLKDTVENEVQI